MEQHVILSERLEDQYRVMEMAEEEIRRMKKELGEQLGREVSAEVREYWRKKKAEAENKTE